MLSGVPGLLTLTTVSEEPSRKSFTSLILFHVMTGVGLPEALQANDTFLPSTTVSAVFDILTDGATEDQRTKKTDEYRYKSCTLKNR